MRNFIFSFFLLFPASLLVADEIREVSNYPDSDYVIISDSIYTLDPISSAGLVLWFFDSEQEAETAYTAVCDSVPQGRSFMVVRSGACDVVSWCIGAIRGDYTNFVKVY